MNHLSYEEDGPAEVSVGPSAGGIPSRVTTKGVVGIRQQTLGMQSPLNSLMQSRVTIFPTANRFGALTEEDPIITSGPTPAEQYSSRMQDGAQGHYPVDRAQACGAQGHYPAEMSSGCNCAPGSEEAGVPKPRGGTRFAVPRQKRCYKPLNILSRENDREYEDTAINALGCPTQGATLVEAVLDSGAVDSVASDHVF